MKITELKSGIRQSVLWTGLFLILLLIIFSIYSAFTGSDNAKVFFNSPALFGFWFLFGLALFAGIVLFPSLHTSVGLLASHLGCILILAGGFWGSQTAVRLRNLLLHSDIIPSGKMIIYIGQTQNEVFLENDQNCRLPFAVKLVDFKIEYYPHGRLLVQTPQGKIFNVPAIPGKKYNLAEYGSVEVLRQFEKFKILLQNNQKTAIDDPNGNPNPALELKVIDAEGNQTTTYAFEKFHPHSSDNNPVFLYRRTISDYISDVEIIKNGSVVAAKSIEVNKPLHFGGYFFYQHSYDDQQSQYTILSVVTDTGLFVVYLGFFLLCAGLFWTMWVLPAWRQLYRKQ